MTSKEQTPTELAELRLSVREDAFGDAFSELMRLEAVADDVVRGLEQLASRLEVINRPGDFVGGVDDRVEAFADAVFRAADDVVDAVRSLRQDAAAERIAVEGQRDSDRGES